MYFKKYMLVSLYEYCRLIFSSNPRPTHGYLYGASNTSHPLGKHVIKSLKGPFISFFLAALRSAVVDRDAHPV